MIIYAIRQEIRDNCEIDTNCISGKAIEDFDDYLFSFPLQRKLAYAYVKYSTERVKLSHVHQLFKSIDDIEWLLHSTTHKKYLAKDEVYARVVTKYIRNAYTWTSSMVHMQPHLFDAKYLRIGRFQAIAHKCNWFYMHTQTMHYSGFYNGVRTLDGLVKHNEWFIERRRLEHQFFDAILSRFSFSPQLRISYYANCIEFFDDNSQLCLQFEIFANSDIATQIIYPTGAKHRGRKVSNTLTMKLLSKYNELFTFYQVLNSLDTRKQYQKYKDKLDQLKVTHSDTWQRLKISTIQVLEDFSNKEQGSAFNEDRMTNFYFVRKDSVERCGMTIGKSKRTFRLYRRVKLTKDKMQRTDTISLSSYNSHCRSIETFAEWLLDVGFINISQIEDRHIMYDYELLSTGKSQTFALQFLKLPQVVASSYFAEYEEQLDMLKHEIDWLHETNVKSIEDTRKFEDFAKLKINTFPEYKHYVEQKLTYEEDRKLMLSQKNSLVNNFIKTNKQIIT